MPQAKDDTIQDNPVEDVDSIEFEAKKEPIEIGVPKEEPLNEDDPRSQIYKKHAEQRKAETEGVPVGSDSEGEPAAVEQMVRVKVNGKDKEVPKSKIDAAGGIEAYQKNAAASELLNQAAAKEKLLQQQEAELSARLAQLEQLEQQMKQRAEQPAPPPKPGADIKELARKYNDALLNGELDEANEYLAQMMEARNATSDPEEVAKKAALRVRQEIEEEKKRERQAAFEEERRAANAEFFERFPDIANDPDLFRLTNQKTVEIMREHQDWSPSKIIEAAAEYVSEKFMGRTATAEDKLEAKRKQVNVRSGSAKAVPRPAPKPVSRSQYVETLRQRRGLE